MRKLSTAPEIRKHVLQRILFWRKWQHHIAPNSPQPDLFGVHEAVKDQDRIGWYNFLLGRLSTKWSDAQERYLQSLKKRNSGRRWTIAVLDKTWDISWDMWEQRNGIAHNTLHPRRLAKLLELQNEVRTLFGEGNEDLLPRDRRLFDKGIDTLLQGSEIELKQWSTSVLLAR